MKILVVGSTLSMKILVTKNQSDSGSIDKGPSGHDSVGSANKFPKQLFLIGPLSE